MRYLTLSLLVFLTISCSSNKEQTVTDFASPSGDNASLPRLFTDNTGTVFMSWVETKNDTSSLFYASLADEKWNEPVLIGASDSWFVNWADFPSIIGKDGKAVAAHWLKKSEGGPYAYDVEIVTAKNNWTDPVSPHNDNTATEHGFVSMVPVSDSTFLSIWLDGRNTAGHGNPDEGESSSKLSTAMTLRSALLDTDLNVLKTFEIDNSVCDCCGTAVVRTESGFITAYRNRTEGEIRDIYVSRYVDGNWSEPITVNNDGWEIAACPVNGPAITSDGKTVAVAWYTGANGIQNVKLALSNDEGNSFQEALEIDHGNPLGRVDVEILTNGNILVSWLERNMEDRSKANFMAQLISPKGNVINEYTISEMSSGRRSGFPQLSSYNNKIIAAWTDLGDGSNSSVKTAILE
tara:strand:- start:1142 stop:2359 length:1218 start_codon:yes stop_codon:yes gene_type:complete